MLKKITEAELPLLKQYLLKNEPINLMFLGNLLHYPMDENHEAYVYLKDDEMTFAFNRCYHKGFLYSENNDYDVLAVSDLINHFRLERISGNTDAVRFVRPYIQNGALMNEFKYAGLYREDRLEDIFCDIREASASDFPRILEIIKETRFNTTRYVELNARKLQFQAGRNYFVSDGYQVVSCAETSMETDRSAMIGEVTTKSDYRRRGYAAQVVSKLCKDVMKEGKTPYLFYNNPDAGRIYAKLGFIDIDFYAILNLNG